MIDDDPSVRDLMKRSLEKEGFRVEAAGEGVNGLQLARQLKPAVITLDVMMPHMDGWSVLSALKEDPATANIPVIMLTIVDDKQMGFALGAADYFTKPIDFQRLHRVLEKYRKPTNQQTVLVVEDDGGTREMLRRALEKEGWQVAEARNGKVGLEQLAKTTPTLILLDLMMPQMDGFEFLQALRLRGDGLSVPVIVITAKDLTEQDHRRLNGGVERIIQKGAPLGNSCWPRCALSWPAGTITKCNPHPQYLMARILLVEDNEMNRDMLSRRLERKGHEVVCAVDGQEGVAKARSEKPDLILMDMSLPILNGWEATQQLKADAATRAIPLIALTAHAMAEDEKKAREAGCDDYDTKPIELPRLLGKIDALLGNAGKT